MYQRQKCPAETELKQYENYLTAGHWQLSRMKKKEADERIFSTVRQIFKRQSKKFKFYP